MSYLDSFVDIEFASGSEDKYILNKNSKTINNILHKINQCKVLKESKK